MIKQPLLKYHLCTKMILKKTVVFKLCYFLNAFSTNVILLKNLPNYLIYIYIYIYDVFISLFNMFEAQSTCDKMPENNLFFT